MAPEILDVIGVGIAVAGLILNRQRNGAARMDRLDIRMDRLESRMEQLEGLREAIVHRIAA